MSVCRASAHRLAPCAAPTKQGRAAKQLHHLVQVPHENNVPGLQLAPSSVERSLAAYWEVCWSRQAWCVRRARLWTLCGTCNRRCTHGLGQLAHHPQKPVVQLTNKERFGCTQTKYHSSWRHHVE